MSIVFDFIYMILVINFITNMNWYQKMAAEKSTLQRTQKKWSKDILDEGFCIVPSILLRAQKRIGVNPSQLILLIQLLDYWWDAGNKPFPSKKDLGNRVGLGPRQVQRYLADLEAAGLIKREARVVAGKGRTTNKYDLSGLVEKLNELAPEFKETRELKKAVERRGGDDRLKLESKNPTI
ncbi:helix-turn-helix domain-containing protein [Acinetobacter baumannii]|uniref:helix-turn-helix domain-containing protein n=2 Tax=Acinetobacter baumannii TaxID=470 RepID=UPI0024DEF6C8|nr:helix-turn-helix domain-containing protein [Acinetobacter baumannii]MDK2104778.1 helix-turn-helix domain-containing protein [Acinetobacter baumannii]MDK2150499.1 helix-turn-helix domain-containing protein [Acinetobacter baumannii]MDK2180147.1 helix-turn-helix domain-containing protein [Acinetobacter baumannii]MDK2198456.1 helix-turn-helix domain-containing protein [Acinetobacter baumannii]MDK2209080.1 helix-turn-helix domain-containing protein [Acinetobacter baumannii]